MVDAIFKRKIYGRLLEWKSRSAGGSAMLLEGARRVGKTTLVQEFGRNEYESYLMIDFMNPLPGTAEIFEAYGHDAGLLLSNLSLLYGVSLKEHKSLVIFDEIQKFPRARELIKYLVKDGRYDYIETGSLISIRENVKDIQIPSEEESLRMNPMDFEEWLWANGESGTMDAIRSHFESRTPLGQTMHRVMLEKFRLYMTVGGMPGAVSAFLGSHDMAESESVKRQILRLYRSDMMKIPKDSGRASALFDSIPAMLSSHRKAFRPGTVEEGSLTGEYAGCMEWLKESGIAIKCSSNTDPSIAMNLSNGDRFKVYLLDTGLLISLAFDVGVVDSSVFADLAQSKLSLNEGMLFENMVAQELVSSGVALYFHEFYRDGDPKHLYEVDFILVRGRKITPIEVKLSSSRRHVSLDMFCEKYRNRIDEAFVIHSKDLRVDGSMTYVPIYMASLIPGSIANVSNHRRCDRIRTATFFQPGPIDDGECT